MRRVDGEDGGGYEEPDGNLGFVGELKCSEPGALICTAVHCHLFNDAQAQTCFVLQRARTRENLHDS